MDSIFELGVAAGGGLKVAAQRERIGEIRPRSWSGGQPRPASECGSQESVAGWKRREAFGKEGARGEGWVVVVLREGGGVWRDGDGMEGGEVKAHMPVESSSSSKRGTKSGWPCDLGSKRPTRKLSRLALSFFPSTKSTTNPTR